MSTTNAAAGTTFRAGRISRAFTGPRVKAKSVEHGLAVGVFVAPVWDIPAVTVFLPDDDDGFQLGYAWLTGRRDVHELPRHTLEADVAAAVVRALFPTVGDHVVTRNSAHPLALCSAAWCGYNPAPEMFTTQPGTDFDPGCTCWFQDPECWTPCPKHPNAPGPK